MKPQADYCGSSPLVRFGRIAPGMRQFPPTSKSENVIDPSHSAFQVPNLVAGSHSIPVFRRFPVCHNGTTKNQSLLQYWKIKDIILFRNYPGGVFNSNPSTLTHFLLLVRSNKCETGRGLSISQTIVIATIFYQKGTDYFDVDEVKCCLLNFKQINRHCHKKTHFMRSHRHHQFIRVTLAIRRLMTNWTELNLK